MVEDAVETGDDNDDIYCVIDEFVDESVDDNPNVAVIDDGTSDSARRWKQRGATIAQTSGSSTDNFYAMKNIREKDESDDDDDSDDELEDGELVETDESDDENDCPVNKKPKICLARLLKGPFLPVTVNQQLVKVMIDTGAGCSCVSLGIAKKLGLNDIEPSELQITGAGGGNLQTTGVLRIPVTICELTKTINFYVLKEDDIFILGLKDMKKFEITVDSGSDGILCNGFFQNYKIQEGPAGEPVTVSPLSARADCNIFLNETVVCEPNCDTIVYGEIRGELSKNLDPYANESCESTEGEAECFLCTFDYANGRYGLLCPKTVVKKARYIPILIRNWYETPVKVFKDSAWGIASTCEVMEDDNAMVMTDNVNEEVSPDNHPVDKVDLGHLDEEERSLVEDMLRRKHRAFARGKNDLGKVDSFKVHIELKDKNDVIKDGPRKYSPDKCEAIKEHVDRMLELGVVRQTTTSPHRSFPVIVRKKDDPDTPGVRRFRFCVDFRMANRKTKPAVQQIPLQQTILDSLAHGCIFSCIDISEGFWNLQLDEESKDLTCFATPTGECYVFNRLPFGLSQAPGFFCAFMNQLFRGAHGVLCYLDDIVVVSKSFSQHLEDVEAVLQRIQAAGMKIKSQKVELFKDRINLLGHEISAEGIAPDRKKLAVVKDWKRPVDVKGIQRFLGFVNFFRRHIDNCARLTEPLTKLTRKDVPFVWTDDCEIAFETLKAKVTSAPILALPDMDKTFFLLSDYSCRGLGWVLAQKGDDNRLHPILYGGQGLTKGQRSMSAYRGELLALETAMKNTKSYLLGGRNGFVVLTDHRSLCYFLQSKEPNAYTVRTLERLAEFGDFKIKHVKGKHNTLADAISRIDWDETGDELRWSDVLNSTTEEKPVLAVLTRARAKELDASTEAKTLSDENGGRTKTRKSTEPMSTNDENRRKTKTPESTEPVSTKSTFQPTKSRKNDKSDAAKSGVELRTDSTKTPERRNLDLTKPEEPVVRPKNSAKLPEKSDEKDETAVTPDALGDASLTRETDVRWSLWVDYQGEDRDLKKLKSFIETDFPSKEELRKESPALRSYYMNRKMIELKDGVLVRKWRGVGQVKSEKLLPIIPAYMIPQLMVEVHDNQGHWGETKTIQYLRKRYYFYGLAAEVRMWVRTCKICNQRKIPSVRMPLKQISYGFFNEMVSIDIKVMSKETRKGHKNLLVMIDGYSKLMSASPMKSQTSEEIFSCFYRDWVTRYGVPFGIMSDRAANLNQGSSVPFFNLLNISKMKTVAFHPQADGSAERSIRTLSALLSKLLNADTDENAGEKAEWDEKVDKALYAYNSSIQTSTGFSPFMLFTGKDMMVSTNLIFPAKREELEVNVRRLQQQQSAMFQVVADNIVEAKNRQKSYYDLRVKYEKLEPGALVLYRKYTVSQPNEVKGFKSHYHPTPFEVIEILSDVNLIIKNTVDDTECICHRNQVKLYNERETVRQSERQKKQVDRLYQGDSRDDEKRQIA